MYATEWSKFVCAEAQLCKQVPSFWITQQFLTTYPIGHNVLHIEKTVLSTLELMATPRDHPTSQQPEPKSPFLQEREKLVGEIAISLEHVLQNINKLNRSLEGVIAVGNEFGAVEALWSQFEAVMTKEGGTEVGVAGEEKEEEEQDEDGIVLQDGKQRR